jgi:hypothetical protein
MILQKSKCLTKIRNLIIEIHPDNKKEEIQMLNSLQQHFKHTSKQRQINKKRAGKIPAL